MKTKEQFAAMLNGRQYRDEITSAEEKEARESGLLVIFGYSDDNVEFRGIISAEFGCNEGGTFKIGPDGVLPEWGRDEKKSFVDARDWFARQATAKASIEAIWDKDGYSWTYRTDLPHATFDILEAGEKFCRGIVIDGRDIK